MSDLFDETESDEIDDDVTVVAIWLVRRRTLGVASQDHGEGESDKSPLCLLCPGHFANNTTDLLPTCYRVVADLLATSLSMGKLWGNWC